MTRIHTPTEFYDEAGLNEWNRLVDTLHGEFEWEATTTYLDRFLPETGTILDAGGGPGRYTQWLAERGYDVALLDASRQQLKIAQNKVDQRPDGVWLVEGSIDTLPYGESQFDATVCLGGPVSHLLTEDRRLSAVSELQRVTRPDGPVFVSVMGRLELLQTLLQQAKKLELLPVVAADGTYDADVLQTFDMDSSFVETHFFRADELEQLLEAAGIDVHTVAGLEGIASLAAKMGVLDDLTSAEQAAVKQTVQQLREDRSVADFSSHIIAVGQA